MKGFIDDIEKRTDDNRAEASSEHFEGVTTE